MAAHAPWGAGNDLPQALPGGKILFLIFYILFCQQKLTLKVNFVLIQTWDFN
jgi:hypothetical protein